jgi:hypothetical protein
MSAPVGHRTDRPRLRKSVKIGTPGLPKARTAFEDEIYRTRAERKGWLGSDRTTVDEGVRVGRGARARPPCKYSDSEEDLYAIANPDTASG